MTENKKDHAASKIHPPVLTLVHILAAFLLKRYLPLPFSPTAEIENFGFILIIIAFALAFSAILEFRRGQTPVDPHGTVKKILSSGIFRFSRNPIYLGMFIMIIGFPLYFGTYWGILFALIFLPSIYYLVIQYEESYLEKKFGAEYIDYKSRVRRWL